MENKNYLTIGKLSSYSGIHIKALRYYESIGILHPALIDANNGYRYYSHAHIPYVKIIKLCADYGIPLGTFNDFIKSETEINLIEIIRKASNILELSKKATGKTLYILDEPTTGLHIADVHRLVNILQRLVDTGNSIVVIEHNLDLIKTADYIIDLGPEGGDKGGTIVGVGTPEQIVRNEKSYTGKFLKKYLE